MSLELVNPTIVVLADQYNSEDHCHYFWLQATV